MKKETKKRLEQLAREYFSKSTSGLDYIPSQEEIKTQTANLKAIFDKDENMVFCFLKNNSTGKFVCAVVGMIDDEGDMEKILIKTKDKKEIKNLLRRS